MKGDFEARDLVCGMKVDPDTAAGKADFKGQTYYFCNPSCEKRFREAPERFLTARPKFLTALDAAPEMARDPVCGMSVDPRHAAAEADYQGMKYYFCCRSCADRFVAAPERFLALGSAARSEPFVQRVEPEDEATQYLCPMHPEVRAGSPGTCTACGMVLEPLPIAPGPRSTTSVPWIPKWSATNPAHAPFVEWCWSRARSPSKKRRIRNWTG